MRFKLVLIQILLFVNCLYCEPGNKFYGKGVFKQMLESPDGNIYLLGVKNDTNFWVTKMDKQLNILWEKLIPDPLGGYSLNVYHLLIVRNGDLIITGSTNLGVSKSNTKSFVARLKNNGQLLWAKRINEAIDLYYCYEEANGQLIFGGITENRGSSTYGGIILTDSNGNVIKTQQIIVHNKSFVKFIDRNNKGNLVLIGRSNVIGVGFEGIFFIEMDDNLNIINQTEFDLGIGSNISESSILEYYDHPNLPVLKNQEGNYLIFHPYQYPADLYYLKLSASGEKIDSKSFGDALNTEIPLNYALLKNGDILITGVSKDNTALGARFNHSINEKWIKFFSADTLISKLYCCMELDNGNLLFGGEAREGSQAWLLQTDSVGNFLKYTINGHVYFDLDNNCMLDSTDIPMQNINVHNKDLSYSATDKEGMFSLKSDSDSNFIQIEFIDDHFKICANPLSIIIDKSTSTGTGDFLVQAKDNCSFLTVQLTQPDLVRCKTSRYIASVENHGIEESDSSELEIYFDDLFTLSNSFPTGIQNPNHINFTVPKLKAFERLEFLIDLNLSCKAFLGQGHTVVAKIKPRSCVNPWNGPKLEIEKKCLNNQAQFTVRNIGSGNMLKNAFYRIYVNQYLLESESFQLKAGNDYSVSIPAYGKSISLEIVDTNNIFPENEFYYSNLESCGLNEIGMINTGYANAFHSKNGNPLESVSITYNTIGVPNRVKEMNEGLSYYHFTDNEEWSEFTLRVQNPKNEIVNKLDLDLSITPNLEITSFQLLSGKAQIFIKDSLHLGISIDLIHLSSNKDSLNSNYYLKFRIKQKKDIPKDSEQESYLGVEAKAYFNGEGPFSIARGWNNLSDNYRERIDSSNIYPAEISTIGGESHDFGVKILESKNGSKYLLVSSGSFSQGQFSIPYIIKLDPKGKMEWEKTFLLNNLNEGDLRSGTITNEGDLIVAGNQISKNFVAKINSDGELIWSSSFSTGLNGYSGYITDLLISKDNFIVGTGISATNAPNSLDNFLFKMDQQGNLLWLKNYIVEGLAFEPSNVFENSIGEFIMAGDDNGRQLIVAQKCNSDGDKIWAKTFTPQLNSDNLSSVSVIFTKEEELIFGGYSTYEDQNTGEYIATPHFIKLSKNGNYLNEATPIVGQFGSTSCDKIILTPDNKILGLGEILIDTSSLNYKSKPMIVMFDLDFKEIWKKVFDLPKYARFKNALIDHDNNINLIGNDQQMPYDYNLQSFFFKTDLDGKIVSNHNIFPKIS
ncbi:MAG: hypothetical protein ABI851_14340 [Saprospiraceae bacterium]